MRDFRNGLLIGKFNPPHIGHEMMIKYGMMMCEEMNVLVSGSETDKVSPRQRANILRKNFYPSIKHNVKIYHEYNGMEESEKDENGTVLDEKYWAYWIDHIKKTFPEVNAIFTNDVYGYRLARELNADWYPIDPKRESVNVSATQIKTDMKKHWNKVLPGARKLYGTRVAIVGPESCGKTTMTKEISRIMDCGCVLEHGRVMSEIRNSRLTWQDFVAILYGQEVSIDAAQMVHPLVISDTEAFTTHQFAKLYLKDQDERFYIETLSKSKAEREQHFDLYILLTPNVKWVDDGMRVLHQQFERNKWFNDMLLWLQSNNKNYVVIDSKDYDQRLQQAIKAVKNISYDRMYESTDNVAISRCSTTGSAALL